MNKGDEELWVETFKRCGLYKHPRKLKAIQKRHQRLLLDALSNNPKEWPEDENLAAWWHWHDEHS